MRSKRLSGVPRWPHCSPISFSPGDLGRYSRAQWEESQAQLRTKLPCRLTSPAAPSASDRASFLPSARVTLDWSTLLHPGILFLSLGNVNKHRPFSPVTVNTRVEGSQCPLEQATLSTTLSARPLSASAQSACRLAIAANPSSFSFVPTAPFNRITLSFEVSSTKVRFCTTFLRHSFM